MTDINSKAALNKVLTLASNQPASLKDSEEQNNILDLIELFYFAYRDFTADGDEVLSKIGFGRAHHRIIHFVYHYPGLRVADLLYILKITKQSLARVLKQLIDEGYIRRHKGAKDRRERRLFTTEKGCALAIALDAPQIERVRQALTPFNEEEREIIEQFLYSILQNAHRHEVITLFSDNQTMKKDHSTGDDREEH